MSKLPARATLLAALLLALPLAASATNANTEYRVKDSDVKHMGHGNVDIALSLAKATLAAHGIHRPTPEQIKVALNGGTITTKNGERVAFPGILKQRASGMGWGKIAQANGLKLGEVMRNKHHRADHNRSKHERDDFHKARFDRDERGHKFERHERHERPERHERRDRY